MALPLAGLGAIISQMAVNAARNTAGGAANITANSLVEYTSVARVEPICVVDKKLVEKEFTTDIMKMMLSRYTALYLAAGSLVGNIGTIKVVQTLDKLNPSRSPTHNLANSILSAATESVEINEIEEITENNSDIKEMVFIENLPEYGSTDSDEEVDVTQESNKALLLNNIKKAGMKHNPDNHLYASMESDSESRNTPVGVTSARVSDQHLVANLSVGHQVVLNLSDNGQSREIPILIRLIAYPTEPSVISTILKWSEKDNSFRSRWRAYKAGELDGWRDLIFMRDVLTERKKTLMKDKTGLFAAMTERNNKNMLSGVLSLTPSVGTISSIAVVHKSTIEDLEDQIDGRLETFSVRQRIMNATGLMTICVVDDFNEVVTIYTYTQSLPETLSIKQIKSASRGGNDITEIIKLLNPQMNRL